MSRLRDMQVGTRLAVAFGLVGLLLAVMLGVGLWGAAGQSRAQALIVHHERVSNEVLQVKFRAAHFNGYQNAYAIDAEHGLDIDDSSGNRKEFLASVDAFREGLDAIEPDEDEQDAVAAIGESFDRYMDLDESIIALYRVGTPESVEEATAVVLGDERVQFETLADETEALADQVLAESEVAHAAGEPASRRARRQHGLSLIHI